MKGLLEVVEEINKIKPETTRNLKAMFGSMERMGRTAMLSPINDALMMPQRQLGLQIGFGIQSMLMPTTMLMNQMINQASNAIIPFLEENRIGAGIGGTIGFIAGFVLPGSQTAWTLALSFVGAGVEAGITDPDVLFQGAYEPTPGDPLGLLPPPDLSTTTVDLPTRTTGRLPVDQIYTGF